MPPISQPLRDWLIGPMSAPSHDFVTVDMRGLKPVLVARAHSERVSVSAIVRRAVACALGSAEPLGSLQSRDAHSSTVKLSIRLSTEGARQLDAGARRAGLSRGAFLAGLLANVPSLSSSSPSRPECLAALTASSAELSTLSRNIHHLTTLLRQGQARAAQEYRCMLDALAGDVHTHLRLAASVLADVQPTRSSGRSSEARPFEAP
jgi:hypothetical protein